MIIIFVGMPWIIMKSYFNFINFNACYFLLWMLSRHLTHVGRLMTPIMMKHLVLWSIQVRTGLKRKEKEEVTVLL